MLYRSANYTKSQEESFYYLLITNMKTHRQKSRLTKFESVRALFVLCTRVTTLHSFSANQKRVIISCTLIEKL